MTYTLQLDFHLDEDEIRADEEIKDCISEIFSNYSCYVSDIKIVEIGD